MNLSDSLQEFSWKMNSSDWTSNSTSGPFLLPVINPLDDPELDSTLNSTESPPMLISNKPCGETLSSETPAVTRLPGSLDALFYIIIVLMFYAFSIVVLMVKYIRREREEANLRNYYYEFVSRDKFRSAQYRNRQFMRRMFCTGSQNDVHSQPVVEEEAGNAPCSTRNTNEDNNQTQTIIRNGSAFSRLLGGAQEITANKESFTFLGVKNQLCKNSFFGKKFCNKQLCSKCVSESAPTIDWGDGRTSDIKINKQKQREEDTIEVRLRHSEQRSTVEINSCKKANQKDVSKSCYLHERDNSIFFPIIECDSDVEEEDVGKQQYVPTAWNTEDVLVHVNYDAASQEAAIVSSCSLEISNLLANMPPLDVASTSNDMDTLDGLSNLESEAGTQSLLNYSASIRGASSICEVASKDSPGIRNKSASGDDRLKDFNDFLSERTSLLSCTLSIDDGEDEDATTNVSSARHHPCGLSLASSSNGKVKDDVRSNGKSILNSLSKSLSSDEGERKKFLNDFTSLTEESGVFKNLKYFLRGFSKYEGGKAAYETLNLLPRETYFGPGSPQSFFGKTQSMVGPTQFDLVGQSCEYEEMDTVDDDLLNLDERDNFGSRWGYTYDTEDEVRSEGDKSSSFGDYCMGDASESQVIDISKPLVRRQLDAETKDILSRAFIGLGDAQLELNVQADHVVDEHGVARRETKV